MRSARRTDDGKVAFEITESRSIPAESWVLGMLAMLPFPVAAILAWVLDDIAAQQAVAFCLTWGGAILALLAGVRRGLSLRTPDGPDTAQLATMLWLFLLAFGSMISPWRLAAVELLAVGFTSVAVLDPVAVKYREVPPFFARLRPLQMMVPILSLAAVGARLLLRS